MVSLLALSAPAHAAAGGGSVAAGMAAQSAPGGDAAQSGTAGNAQEDRQANEILVIAARLRGQVDAAQPPLMTLDEEDIASYGASTINDLVAAISPQTGSGRDRGGGRPVFLVNGERISSFRELHSIPPEAIRKLEVLPEEVALRYGYPPNQRVVNFILKDDYASRTVAGEYHLPTNGGFHESELEGTLLSISGPRRLNLTAKLNDTSLLTEAERGVRQDPASIPTVAGDPDPARFRSLIDDSRTMSLNGTWSIGLGAQGEGGKLALNGQVERADSRSLFGLDTVLLQSGGQEALRSLPGALVHTSRSTTFSGGATFSKPLGDWQLTATVDGSYNDTRARTDREADLSPILDGVAAATLAIDAPLPALPGAGFDRARTRDSAVASLLTLVGQPLRLPAGEASLTARVGLDFTKTDNSDTASQERSKLDRRDLSAGFNLALPLTSRKERVLGAIGDLSLNFSGGINHLSDFGTLKDWSAGLTWQPTGTLNLQASYIVNEAAPSLNQLGNPTQFVFNVPVFDYTTGHSVLATIINGGNPNLVREKQRDLKLSLNWELPVLPGSNLVVDWFRNRSSNVTQSFPLLTSAIEAAFPGRAVRDAAGNLLSIDRRPVTFREVAASRLRWGVNLSGQIGKEDARGGRGGDRAGSPMMALGRGHGGAGRWNVALYHTWRISETATIAAAGPKLDLLGRDAIRTGGVARHQIELEGGVFHKGIGLRANGTWTAPTRVAARAAPGSADLRFGSVFDLDLRLFVSFDQRPGMLAAAPFLKGSRLALKIDNLLDSHQKVTDAAGAVPISYQADYRDPRGRTIGLDFRKMF